MKELSIEEKAQRYDEAIEKFDVILNLNTVKESGTIFAEDVRKIFPELKESEDERIRQFLIHEVTETSDEIISYRNMNKEDILAWLEKQGERKPAWSEEDENNILFLTSIIEECFKDKEKITLCSDTTCATFTKEDVIDRLNSLKPQPKQ